MFLAKEGDRGRMMRLLSGRCLNPKAGERMRHQRPGSSKEPSRRETLKMPVTDTGAEYQGEQRKSISSALISADRGLPKQFNAAQNLGGVK